MKYSAKKVIKNNQIHTQKNLVFGDSFINFLSLINTFKIKKFSGKTMKGMTKDKSPIYDTVKKMSYSTKAENIIFGFGNVDLHLSFYHDIFNKPDYKGLDESSRIKLWEERTREVITEYVNKVKNLNLKNKKIYFFQAFPSTLIDKNVIPSLTKYIQFDEKTLSNDEKKMLKNFIKRKNRHDRYLFFNRRLKIEAKKAGFEYIDIEKHIINKDTSKIKQTMIDISQYNIHLLWEPLLIKLTKHNILNKMGITKESTSSLEESHNKYLKLKQKLLDTIDPFDEHYMTKKKKFLEENL